MQHVTDMDVDQCCRLCKSMMLRDHCSNSIHLDGCGYVSSVIGKDLNDMYWLGS